MFEDILSSGRLEALINEFCGAFPARAAGSDGERLAAEWTAARMREAGLDDVRVEPIPFSIRQPVACDVRSGDGRSLLARPLLGVPSCSELEFEVIDAGLGTPEDYERLRGDGARLEGTAHLTWRGGQGPGSLEMDRFEKQHFALAHGAAAWLHAMDVDRAPFPPPQGVDAPPLEGGLSAVDGTIPAVTLAAADAHDLRRIALSIDSPENDLTTWLVIGTLRGTSDEEVILGAQLDAVEWARFGAPYDNGAGVAAILLLAEAFTRRSPRRTLTVAAIGGEEPGTIASRYLAGDRLDGGTIAMVNMDSWTQKEGWVGVSSYGPGSFGEGALDRNGPFGGNANTSEPDSLARRLLAKIEEAGYPPGRAYLPRRTEWTSDHYPFGIIGIPSVWAFKKPAIFHCEYDTMAMMDWDDAAVLARAHAMLLDDLLSSDSQPRI